jgi:hypothetical protein
MDEDRPKEQFQGLIESAPTKPASLARPKPTDPRIPDPLPSVDRPPEEETAERNVKTSKFRT